MKAKATIFYHLFIAYLGLNLLLFCVVWWQDRSIPLVAGLLLLSFPIGIGSILIANMNSGERLVATGSYLVIQSISTLLIIALVAWSQIRLSSGSSFNNIQPFLNSIALILRVSLIGMAGFFFIPFTRGEPRLKRFKSEPVTNFVFGLFLFHIFNFLPFLILGNFYRRWSVSARLEEWGFDQHLFVFLFIFITLGITALVSLALLRKEREQLTWRETILVLLAEASLPIGLSVADWVSRWFGS